MLYQLSYAGRVAPTEVWSGVRESNPCKSAWKADARPLGQPRATISATDTIVRNGGEWGQFGRSSLRTARAGHVSAWPMRNEGERTKPAISDENCISRSYRNLICASRR